MSTKKTSFWLTPKGLAALGFIGAVTYFLLMEHRQHVWQYLPFLILFACLFMHLFMHRGHGGHGGHSNHRDQGGSEDGEPDQDTYQRGLEEDHRQAKHNHQDKNNAGRNT